MNGNIFPNLVKVFYTNLTFEGENISSHVKGVEMEITPDVWTNVTSFKYTEAKVGKGNNSALEDFNKMQYYISCLRNHLTKVKGFHVGALKLNECVITFITTWILKPNTSNHVLLTKEDLVLVYCKTKKIKVNWIYVFKEYMLKYVRLSDYHFPYVILV